MISFGKSLKVVSANAALLENENVFLWLLFLFYAAPLQFSSTDLNYSRGQFSDSTKLGKKHPAPQGLELYVMLSSIHSLQKCLFLACFSKIVSSAGPYLPKVDSESEQNYIFLDKLMEVQADILDLQF